MPGGWEESAEAWVTSIDRGDALRETIIKPELERILPRYSGHSAVDIGCGEGWLVRMMREHGIQAEGIDATLPLVEEANRRLPGSCTIADAVDTGFADGSFDLATSCIVFVDLPDLKPAISEMCRILRPGGIALVANLNPYATSVGTGWIRSESKEAKVFPVDNYGLEHGMRAAWSGIDVVNYHRPLCHYMQAFLSESMILRSFDEPLPSVEILRARPRFFEDIRAPLVHIMEWQKPA